MQSSMLKAIVEDFGNGGTIDGDLTISGDLTVSGGGSLSFDEILEGTQVIDVTSTEALLVRKNGDGGDVFLVDTTNSNAELTGDMKITNTAATIGLEIAQSGDNHALKIDQDDADKSAIFIDAESTTAHVIYIDGAATTTAAVIRMDGLGGLTTGAMFNANITSTTLETGADTGAFRIVHSGNSGSKVANIMHLHNDDASSTGTTVLKLQQDSTAPALVAMGNVGIGTAAPSTPLHIYENTSTTSTAGVLIEQDGSGDCLLSFLTSGIQRWVTGIDSSDSAYKIAKTTNLGTDTVLTLDTSSNVGIQNPAPGSLLEISKVSGRASLELSSWSATATAAHAGVLKFQKSGTATVNTFTAGDHTTAGEVLGRIEAYGVDDADGSTLSSYIEFANDAVSDADSSPGKITFATSDADDAGTPTVAMTIDDSQNIGVGTDTPLGTIHAVSSDVSWSAPAYGDEIIAENNGDAGISIVSSNESYLVLSNANRSGSYSALIYSAYNSGNDYLAINTVGGGEVMRLDHSGNVGVGTGATIDENIHIKGAGVVSAKIQSTDSADLSLIYSHASRTVTTGLDQSADAFSICNGTVLTAVGASTTLLNLDIGGASRISLSNNDSGTSNTIFGKSAGASLDAGSNYNVFIGEAVSDASMNDATNNVGVGYSALSALTTGDYNTCVGSGAGGGTTDGVRNVFIGQAAGETSTSITYAVGIGGNAIGGAQATADAIGTVAVGYSALTALTSGARNVAVGYNAGLGLSSSNDCTFIGYQAGEDVDSLGSTPAGCTYVGSYSGKNLDDGTHNTALGFNAMVGTTGGATCNLNVGVGKDALESIQTGDQNVVIGADAGAGTVDVDNAVMIGYGAGRSVMTNAADGSVGVGADALASLSSGIGNVAIGYQSLDANATSDYNTAVGYSTLGAVNSDGAGMNSAVGYNAGGSITSGLYNTILGANAGDGFDAESDNTFIGYAVGGNPSLNGAGKCVGVGSSALGGAITQDGTVAIGYNTLASLTTGAGNVAIGYLAGQALIGGGLNTILGYQALDAATTVNNTIAIGHSSMGAVPADQAVENAIAIGQNAMLGSGSTTTGINGNIAIGYEAGKVLTTGGGNTLIGYSAGDELTTGQNNTIVGRHTLGNGDGDEDDNTLIGYAAGDVIDNGNQITCLGSGTDPSTAAGANQTVIGYGTTGVADNSVTLGNASVTDVYMGSDSGALVHTAGIQFPASQAANAGANVLDDYEEGSWTIAVTCATSGTYTLNAGYDRGEYTKIGRIVHAQGYGSISSNSSPVGDTRISLPFAAADLTEYAGHTGGSITIYNMNFTGNFYAMEIQEGLQYFRIVEITDGSGHDYVEGSELANDFYFNVTYIAA